MGATVLTLESIWRFLKIRRY